MRTFSKPVDSLCCVRILFAASATILLESCIKQLKKEGITVELRICSYFGLNELYKIMMITTCVYFSELRTTSLHSPLVFFHKTVLWVKEHRISEKMRPHSSFEAVYR